MAAVVDNFTIEAGTDFERQYTWEDAAGAPIDLSNWTARAQLRPAIASNTISHSMTTDVGGGIVLGSDGTVTLTIDNADTSGFTETKYVYDIELIDSDGKVSRLAKGTITIDPEVTR